MKATDFHVLKCSY